MPIAVLIEEGRRRTFASALDWPGWSRSATTRDDALVALDAYRDRYGGVLAASRLDGPIGALRVKEVLAGDATTDFGAPSAIADADDRALRAADRERHAAILVACWSRLDVVASSSPKLRPGPRGGGRDLATVQRHVTEAEVAYARGLGLRVSATNGDPELVEALRERVLGVLARTVTPERDGRWPLRYAVRRIAWHVCDHLFEIEDRAIAP
ncbi:MAG TPA: hypothetical protein VGZ33_02070 [Acidimicrobiales bacterium]|nr:hypothetical protein [Acidimicrobiales bacterium]